MRTFVIFISIIFHFTSCEQTEVISDDIVARAPVLSVSVSSKSNSHVQFTAVASWHNGCGSFSHFTAVLKDSDFLITVFGKQPKDAFCTQAFIEFDAPVEITVPQSGTYRFSFWQSDSTSVDTTITF